MVDAGQLVYPLDRAYDAVLLCTGWKFDSSIFAAEALPQMAMIEKHQRRSRSKKYLELTHAYESSNVHGMYFAGTLTHGKEGGSKDLELIRDLAGGGIQIARSEV